MNAIYQKSNWVFVGLVSLAIALSGAACDLTYIHADDPGAAREITKNERDELETSGHFLKLTYMPRNTQIPNVMFAQIANAVAAIAKLDTTDDVRIYRETDTPTATVYLPLVYNDGSEFTETGSFFAAFAIHVDAVTSYIFSRTQEILVPFIDGRGELDVRTLPISDGTENDILETYFMSDKERDELEKTGRFLKITNMPLNTQAANVASVQIANSITTVARLDKEERMSFYREKNDTTTVYLPLIYNDAAEFTETGSFYVALAIHVDVLSTFILTLSDKIMVPFVEGRGTLDIRSLPYKGPGSVDRRCLTIFNLPPNLLPQNVSKVFIYNQTGPIALCEDYSLVEVTSFAGSSTAAIPLSFANPSAMFTGTGSFYVAFDLYVDALTHFTFTSQDRLLVSFTNGNGFLDINDLPVAADPDRRCLTITNLPANLIAQNIAKVMIHNQTGPVARCEDYNLLEITVSGARASVRIPLSFINTPSKFTGTGRFFVAFDITIDADTRFDIPLERGVLVSFVDGNGFLDITNLPDPPPPQRRYLTITNLPANLIAQNIAKVMIHNQTGAVARCEDYSLVEVTVSGSRATAKIPLSFTSPVSMFTGTGRFIVAFDINIDAVTRYFITEKDEVLVSFTNGNGSLNIENIPKKPIPYLTIKGLPANTLINHISDIGVFNMVDKVAECKDYDKIVLSVENASVTVKIPLSYSADDSYFKDTGRFVITFTVNVDIDTQLKYEKKDDWKVNFVEGSAEIDLGDTFGFFDAQLTNPDTTAAPIIKGGSAFDIDGLRHSVPGNLPITANPPTGSGVLYLYAFHSNTDVYYEYSFVKPDFNISRNGWYDGYKRALWKMVYIHDGSLFLFKTYIEDDFPHLGSADISNAVYTSLTGSRTAKHSISGSANPGSTPITLDPGVYVVRLTGSGGGGGSGAVNGTAVSGSSAGGAGGTVSEVFTVSVPTAFTAYTGSGGSPAPQPTPSGTFAISGTQIALTWYSDTITGVSEATTLVNLVSLPAASGGGGGGGGAGTFLHSAQGYFLVAGGGGGGSGASFMTPGGAGGSGGAIGPGAGGGAAGYLQQSFKTATTMTASGGHGGQGGGNGGQGGQATTSSSVRNGSNAAAILSANTALYSEIGTPSYAASGFNLSSYIRTLGSPGMFNGTPATGDLLSTPVVLLNTTANNTTTYVISGDSGTGGNTPAVLYPSGPQTWLNTKDAGGAGAAPGALPPVTISGYIAFMTGGGQLSYSQLTGNFSFSLGSPIYGRTGTSGGNNRNAAKGGGALGGAVSSSLPSAGQAGSLTIHQIF